MGVTQITGPAVKFNVTPFHVTGSLTALALAASIMSQVVANTASIALQQSGDSLNSTANPASTYSTARPDRMMISAVAGDHLNAWISTKRGSPYRSYSIDLSYYDGTTTNLMPVWVQSGATSGPNTGTNTMKGRVVPASGYVAYYFPGGLNHVAFTGLPGPGVSGTFGLDGYIGDVTSSVPATAGSGSPTITLAPSGTKFLSSYSWDGGWGQTANITMDGAQVQFGSGVNHLIFKVAENVDLGVTSGTGCTIVLRAGNTGIAFGRLLCKRGGTTFQDGWCPVSDESNYGQARDNNYDTSGSPTSTYFGSTQGVFRTGVNIWRQLDSLQPRYQNPSVPVACNLGRNAASTYVIHINAAGANTGSSVDTWVWGAAHPSGAEITTWVANMKTLADDAQSRGMLFVYHEHYAIGDNATYHSAMTALEAMLVAHPAGIFVSDSKVAAAELGLSLADARVRTKLVAGYSSLQVNAADAPSVHFNNTLNIRSGRNLAALFISS